MVNIVTERALQKRELEEQDDWTLTSAWLDPWEGHNIDYEVMDYFQYQTYRLQDK